jgi:hypothetical protein
VTSGNRKAALFWDMNVSAATLSACNAMIENPRERRHEGDE